MKQRILGISSRLGIGEEAIEAYYTGLRLLNKDPIQLIDDSLLTYEPDDEMKGEVLLPMIPGSIFNNYRACIIAHAFRVRGYRPLIIHCDKGLFRCFKRSVDWDSDAVCDVCEVKGRRTIEAFGLDYYTLSEVASSTQITIDGSDLRSVTYKGLDISTLATATAREQLRRYTLDLSTEQDRHAYRDLLKNGILLADIVDELLETREIVATMVMEDQYIHGGVPLQLSAQHDVPGYAIENGFRDGTIVFGRVENRTTFPFFSDESVISERVETPLTDEQRQQVDSLFHDRIEGDSVMYQYSPDTDHSVGETESKKTVAMFTNLIWDASLQTSERGAYGDVLEWIEETVTMLSGRSDVRLIVKTHPAESSRGTRQPVGQFVRSTFSPLASNVDILPPDTPVNTYELIRDLDVGIVFNSTVGLEAAYQGCPVVVGGDTHYRDLGFTFDPETKSGYDDVLRRLGELEMTEEMRNRAQRYMYFMLLKKCIDFPFLTGEKDGSGLEPLSVSYDDVRVGREPFDSIVDRMVSGEPIVNTWE